MRLARGKSAFCGFSAAIVSLFLIGADFARGQSVPGMFNPLIQNSATSNLPGNGTFAPAALGPGQSPLPAIAQPPNFSAPADLNQPELPNGSPDQSPTDSGAALTGNGKPVAASDIGVGRHYFYTLTLGVRATYDDNIFLRQTNKESDEFLVINLALILGLGDSQGGGNYFRFEYDPDAEIYLQHDENDALEHSVNVSGAYTFSKLTITGRATVQILDGTDVTTTTPAGAQSTQANLDVSGRTRHNAINLMGNFRYSISDKTSTDLGFEYSLNSYAALLSSDTYQGDFFVNYAYSEKLTFGLGTTVGRTLSEGITPGENYFQGNARTSYELTGKILIAGSFGFEFRTFDGSDKTDFGPVFNLNAIYLPFDGTAISATAARTVSPSAVLGGQSLEEVDFSISVRQRLLQRFYLSLTAGYENTDYIADIKGLSASRKDNYFYIQPALDFVIHDKVNVGISALHRQNFSTANFGFDDNQVSLFVSFTF